MKLQKLIVWVLLMFLFSTTAGAADPKTTEAELQSQTPAQAEPATNAEQANQEQHKAKAAPKRSKPVDSFVPSEKVSPDRSVSFPVDI